MQQEDNVNSTKGKGKSPAFQFYPGDWFSDNLVRAMTLEQKGWYIDLLAEDWMNNGLHPDTIYESDIFKRASSAAQGSLKQKYIQHPSDPSLVTHKRLYKIRKEQEERRRQAQEAGQKGGKARVNNALQRQATLKRPLVFASSETQANSSSSSSSSSSIDISLDKSKEIYTPLPARAAENGTRETSKKVKAKFDPEGKKKFLDWVYLSDEQFECVKAYYQERGLSKDLFLEAIRELDRWFSNNPKKRNERTDDAKALMGWPLDAALKRKRELIYTKKAEG